MSGLSRSPGRWIGSWVLASGLAVACGDLPSEAETSDSSDALAQIQERCVEQCVRAADGEGCDTDAIVGACPGVCAFLADFLSVDCLTEYEAVIACESEQSFVCDGALEIEGIDWPVIEDGLACEESDALYEACFGTIY